MEWRGGQVRAEPTGTAAQSAASGVGSGSQSMGVPQVRAGGGLGRMLDGVVRK